jgi:hypothetical protein
MTRFLTLLAFVNAFAAVLYAQNEADCVTVNELIQATYNFKPSRLTDADRASKSSAMDRFWNTLQENPQQSVPCLKKALAQPNADRWFRFDGSTLLVEMDPSTESKAIQVRGYTEADLEDIDLRTWVSLLARRAVEGFDVSGAVRRWLEYPAARYSVPEHGGFTVNAVVGAVILFGSMSESQATPALVGMLAQQGPLRELAVQMLTMQATPESLSALKGIDSDTVTAQTRERINEIVKGSNLLQPRATPKTTRDEFVQAFRALVDGKFDKFFESVVSVSDGEKDVVAVMQPEDIPLLRQVRRTLISSGSPDAIEFYSTFTEILRALVAKADTPK